MGLYRSASLISAAFFLAQLAAVAIPQVSSLDPDAQALALQGFVHGQLSGSIATLAHYAAIGFVLNALPFWLCAKILSDFRQRPSGALRDLATKRNAPLGMFALTAGVLCALNHWLFPDSRALGYVELLFEQPASPVLQWGLPTIAAAVLVTWAVAAAPARTLVAAGAGAVVLFAIVGRNRVGAAPAERRPQPDVIVIGVDSLRPDHLTLYGYKGPSLAPNTERFLAESQQFSDARTVQARTFVAYTSILTGQYPTRTGARENLYPADEVHSEASIAHVFRTRGYQTIFAMDESRFANIGGAFGFDTVVAPPAGAMDFLVGGVLDTAGTNLAQLLPFADILLPHVAGNRAASNVYRPAVHSAKLARAIRSSAASRPLFLVAHFCEPHVPYATPGEQEQAPPPPFSDSPASYRAAVRDADRQVGDLLSELRASGRLENAVVVVLSDHGEGLGMRKDSWRISSGASTAEATQFMGHGWPAFDDTQNRVVLGMQRFVDGHALWPSRVVATPATLVDVAPTLLTAARVPYAAHRFDGENLIASEGAPTPISSERPVFVESGLTGQALQSRHVNAVRVANQFAYLYRRTADGRYEIRPDMLAWQLVSKERAVFVGDTGLSTWRPAGNPSERCWLAIDAGARNANCVTDMDLSSRFSAERALLCTHFASDREFSAAWCPSDALRHASSTLALPDGRRNPPAAP